MTGSKREREKSDMDEIPYCFNLATASDLNTFAKIYHGSFIAIILHYISFVNHAKFLPRFPHPPSIPPYLDFGCGN